MGALFLIPGFKTAMMYIIAAVIVMLVIAGFSFKNDIKEFLGMETTSTLKVKLADQVKETEKAVEVNKELVTVVDTVKHEQVVSDKVHLEVRNGGLKLAGVVKITKIRLATNTHAAAEQVVTLELKFDKELRMAQDNLSSLVVDEIQAAYNDIETSVNPT